MINYRRIPQIAAEQLTDQQIASLLPLIDEDVQVFVSDKGWPVDRAINAACQRVKECGFGSLSEFLDEAIV